MIIPFLSVFHAGYCNFKGVFDVLKKKIDLLKKYTTWQWLLISAVVALFVIYPDITWLPYELQELSATERIRHISFFALRYIFFIGVVFILAKVNLERLDRPSLQKRLLISVAISLIAYCLYGGIAFLLSAKIRHFGSLVLFQILIVSVLCTLLGHIILLYTDKLKKELEIEELTVKNLQTSYDALTNQINPHFFFNSLNGLTSLIRKKNEEVTLAYVNKLSDVFRYILQSDKKGLVSLAEELDFVNSFRYMMEVRFANKLQYNVRVDENKLQSKIPVLSILPLLDNVVVHNMIDSDHKMSIDIYTNDKDELVISNPVYPKLAKLETNGSGLKNLEGRFMLLLGKSIEVENEDGVFAVYLPLKS